MFRFTHPRSAMTCRVAKSLLGQMGLFASDPKLISAGEYTIESDVDLEVVDLLFARVMGDEIGEVTPENAEQLRALCRELGFTGFKEEIRAVLGDDPEEPEESVGHGVLSEPRVVPLDEDERRASYPQVRIASRTVSRIEERIEDNDMRLEGFYGELVRVHSDNEGLKKANKELQAEIENLRKEVAELRKEMDDRKQETGVLRDETSREMDKVMAEVKQETGGLRDETSREMDKVMAEVKQETGITIGTTMELAEKKLPVWTRIGDYVIGKLCAPPTANSFVYEAQSMKDAGKYVFKYIRPNKTGRESELIRGEIEANSTLAVCEFLVIGFDVVPIDVGTLNETFGYFMDRYTRGDLLDFIIENSIPESAAAEMAFRVLCALRNMHAMGWAHRDVKLENVFLTGDGDIPDTFPEWKTVRREG